MPVSYKSSYQELKLSFLTLPNLRETLPPYSKHPLKQAQAGDCHTLQISSSIGNANVDGSWSTPIEDLSEDRRSTINKSIKLNQSSYQTNGAS